MGDVIVMVDGAINVQGLDYEVIPQYDRGRATRNIVRGLQWTLPLLFPDDERISSIQFKNIPPAGSDIVIHYNGNQIGNVTSDGSSGLLFIV